MNFRTLYLLFLMICGAAFAAGEPGPTVTNLGPSGGDVRSLVIHPGNPSQLYLGTADGQLFQSANGGESWTRISPGLDRRELVLDSIAFDSSNPDTIYVAGWELKSDRGELYRSSNGGEDWERLDTGTFHSSIRAMAVSPVNPKLIALGMSEGVLLSQDGGQNWDRISRGYRSLHNVHSLAFDPKEETLLYAGTFRLAWKTPNLGKNWQPIHEGMFWDSDLFSIQIDEKNPSTVFAGACSGIYRSHSNGEKWLKLKSGLPEEAKRTRAVRIDPIDSSTIYAGTTEGLFQSTDGGDTWRNLVPAVVINDIAISHSDSQVVFLATDDAGVLKSVDRGKTFRQVNDGFSQRQVSSVAVRPGSDREFFASIALDGTYGGFFYSLDGGNAWKPYNEGLGETVASIRAILAGKSSQNVFVATTQGIFVGSPGMKPWNRYPSTRQLHINGFAFADTTEQALLLAAQEGIYVLDADSGKVRRVEIPIYKGQTVHSVFFSREDNQAFIGTDMGVFASSDGGKSWTIRVEGLPYARVNIVSKISSRLFCATSDGLFYSDNLGARWYRSEGVLPIAISEIGGGTADGGTVFAADSLLGYLFTSHDLGQSWTMFDLGKTASRISRIALIQDGELLAGTVSEGVIKIDYLGTGRTEPEFAASGANK